MKIDIKRAWEKRVGPETAHLKEGKFLKIAALNDQFRKGLQDIDLEDKVIFDYGCGGGFLGLYLLSRDVPIKKYIGVDITDRALGATREHLTDYIKMGKVETVKIDPMGIPDLSIFRGGIDIFTCFNVIQHFPNQEYFDYFFDKLNNSKIQNIVLNYREGAKTVFQEEPYKTTHEINMASYTTKEDIWKKLDNYKMMRISKKQGDFRTIEFCLNVEND